MTEHIIASGKIFELVQTTQPDGRVFEVARRAPGVRIIIHDAQAQKILLTREFRHELGEWDYRLPGGKVFDTLEEFAKHRESGDDIVEAAKAQAIREAKQEAGVAINTLELYKKSVLGATVEWDLYVFATSDWQLSEIGQELEAGEQVENDLWVSFGEARQMVLTGKMAEERIALVLLRWLSSLLDG